MLFLSCPIQGEETMTKVNTQYFLILVTIGKLSESSLILMSKDKTFSPAPQNII